MFTYKSDDTEDKIVQQIVPNMFLASGDINPFTAIMSLENDQ